MRGKARSGRTAVAGDGQVGGGAGAEKSRLGMALIGLAHGNRLLVGDLESPAHQMGAGIAT